MSSRIIRVSNFRKISKSIYKNRVEDLKRLARCHATNHKSQSHYDSFINDIVKYSHSILICRNGSKLLR